VSAGIDWVGGGIALVVVALIFLVVYVASLRSDRTAAEDALAEARDLVHGLGVLDPTLLGVLGRPPRWHPYEREWQRESGRVVFDVAKVRRLAETQSTARTRTTRDAELESALVELAAAREAKS
jgi:hypothetical protein